jgi:hypothetical protein
MAIKITELNEAFGRFIDEKVAEYERMIEDLDQPLKADKMGIWMAPQMRLYLEREQDRR